MSARRRVWRIVGWGAVAIVVAALIVPLLWPVPALRGHVRPCGTRPPGRQVRGCRWDSLRLPRERQSGCESHDRAAARLRCIDLLVARPARSAVRRRARHRVRSARIRPDRAAYARLVSRGREPLLRGGLCRADREADGRARSASCNLGGSLGRRSCSGTGGASVTPNASRLSSSKTPRSSAAAALRARWARSCERPRCGASVRCSRVGSRDRRETPSCVARSTISLESLARWWLATATRCRPRTGTEHSGSSLPPLATRMWRLGSAR